MEKEMISFSTLKKVLSTKELKNILGGTGVTGPNKWCYCDGEWMQVTCNYSECDPRMCPDKGPDCF